MYDDDARCLTCRTFSRRLDPAGDCPQCAGKRKYVLSLEGKVKVVRSLLIDSLAASSQQLHETAATLVQQALRRIDGVDTDD